MASTNTISPAQQQVVIEALKVALTYRRVRVTNVCLHPSEDGGSGAKTIEVEATGRYGDFMGWFPFNAKGELRETNISQQGGWAVVRFRIRAFWPLVPISWSPSEEEVRAMLDRARIKPEQSGS
jgi:hypothetical protein